MAGLAYGNLFVPLGQLWLLMHVNHAVCTPAGKALPTKIAATYPEERQAAQQPA